MFASVIEAKLSSNHVFGFILVGRSPPSLTALVPCGDQNRSLPSGSADALGDAERQPKALPIPAVNIDVNLRIAQYIHGSSCGDWGVYSPPTAWNQSDRMRKVGRLSLFNRPICHSDPVLGASASATNCIDKTPRRRRIRKAVARALSFTTYATPVTIDDGPAKQVKRDRELIIACDVARSIDSPPVLAAFEVLCHEKHCSHRSPQIQRRN